MEASAYEVIAGGALGLLIAAVTFAFIYRLLDPIPPSEDDDELD